MPCSTYKSFGVSVGGLEPTNELDLAEQLDRITYAALTANFDLARTTSLMIAASDILAFGPDHACTRIANAHALAATLTDLKLAIHRPVKRGGTFSHHVALRTAK